MKISACLIAKNEEETITRCINSYKSIVDEIVVIDTGSTDQTVEVARGLGAKVYRFAWQDDFAAAKNYALSKVRGEWVLFLDADEYLDLPLSANLRRYLKEINKTNVNAVACKMINIDPDTNKVLNSIVHVRILRNDGKVRYKNKIHEELEVDGGNLKLFFLEPHQLVIYHTGYRAALSKDKARRNLNLLLSELEKNPRPRLYHYLSDAYLTLEQYIESKQYAELVIASNISIPGYDSKSYQNIIHSMVNLSYKVSEINSFIEQCILKFPKHPVFHLYLARSKFSTKEYAAAIDEYEKVLVLQQNYKDIEINFVDSALPEVHFRLGSLYELKNDYPSGISSYTQALKQSPYYAEAFQCLINLIKRTKDEDIIALLNSIYDKRKASDIEFLVDQLSKLKLGKVLFYYTNIWLKDFQQNDLALLFVFLANYKYDKAFELFSNCYFQDKSNWSALFSVVSAMLIENPDKLKFIRDYVKPSFQRIISAFSQYDGPLLEDDIEDYTEILKELVLIAGEPIINRYTELQSRFPVNVAGLVGNAFFELKDYARAIVQYQKYIENILLSDELLSEYYFNIAFCHYKLLRYPEALNNFEHAERLGYCKKDLYEFLNWIRTDGANGF